MQRTETARKGFTLIELLVVISIIALLVGILLPALGAARKSAQRIKSLSNVRQIGTAIYGYAADNKDLWIPGRTPYDQILSTRAWSPASIGGGPGGKKGWIYSSLLLDSDYLGGAEVFVCPSLDATRLEFLTDDYNDDTSFFEGHAAALWNEVQYGYNAVFMSGMGKILSETTAKGIGINPNVHSSAALKQSSLDDARSSSATIVLADSKNYAAELGGGGNGWVKGDIGGIGYLYPADDPITAQTGFTDARHQASINVFWADGHGANIKVTDTDHPYAQSELTNPQTGTPDEIRANFWDLN